MMKAEPAPTVIFFFLGEDLGLDQRQKGTSSLKEAPQMGQSWENNGKAEADLSSRYFTLLGFEHRNFRSSCMKNEKAGLAVVWVMGEESEGNLWVMPRFQSRNNSSLDQLQAELLLQCYPLGSQLHSGKTKTMSTPKSFELISF